MQDLNTQQKLAAEFSGKHLLVLAGAGTGKTKTIVARSQYLIDNGVDPKKIQILTFTKKASAEIVSRISTKKSDGSVGGSTFHSWCNHLLLRFPHIFKVSNFTVIDEDDQVAMMKLVCGNKSVVYQGLKIKPEQLVDLYSFFRNSKINLTTAIRTKFFNRHDTPEINEQIEGIKPKITEILQQYQQKKQANRYVDYDDILIIVAKGLSASEEARKLVSSHYEHILVDEMQDTNPLQWDLLKNFVEHSHLFAWEMMRSRSTDSVVPILKIFIYLKKMYREPKSSNWNKTTVQLRKFWMFPIGFWRIHRLIMIKNSAPTAAWGISLKL